MTQVHEIPSCPSLIPPVRCAGASPVDTVRSRTRGTRVLALAGWLGLFGAFAVVAGAQEPLSLVVEGKPMAAIILPSVSERQAVEAEAAKMLSDHLFLMSGARLPVLRERELGAAAIQDGKILPEEGKGPSGAAAFVLVGEGELSRKLGVTSEGLGAGGLRVKTSGNALVLLGGVGSGDPNGVRHAAIEFLESLGVRYLWPGEEGRVVPSRRTITVKSMDVRFTPPIGQRAIRFLGMSERPRVGLERLQIPEEKWKEANQKALALDLGVWWGTWQRLGGSLGIGGGHAGGGLEGGWEKHGASHPEWFALQPDGTRDQTRAKERFRLCVSNPGLVEEVARGIIERAKANPALTCVSLSPNDGGLSSFCMCEECRKLDPPDGPKIKMLVFDKVGESARKEIDYVSLTDRYVHYWNAVAERVVRVHPKLLFLVDAYSYYSAPPVREKLHPNLVVRYVPSTIDGWGGWQKAGASRIYWRPNILLAGRNDGKLHVMAKRLADTIGFLSKNGMLAVDFDSVIHYWAVHGLNYYTAARMAWNPGLTAEDILDDWCGNGFGTAADPVREYFLKAQAITEESERNFTPERIRELRRLLDRAATLARADREVTARLDFLRLGLNFTELQQTLDDLATRARDGDATVDKARAGRLIELNYLTLRDFILHHHFALHSPYLMYGTGDFAKWQSIGGRGYRPEEGVLARVESGKFTLTGKENGLDEMLASFAVADHPAPSKRALPAPKQKGPVEADEQGRVIQPGK